jgi:hypothetical protein
VPLMDRTGRVLLSFLVGLVLCAGVTTGADMAWATSHANPPPQLGFNTYVQDLCQSNAVWASDARGQFSELKALGANSIALAFPLYMASLTSNVVYADRVCGSGLQTPSPSRLRVAIAIAHSLHLRVFLRPLLGPLTGAGWRGTIGPTNTGSWFRSYLTALAPYLRLAQAQKVEYFALSTELDSMGGRANWKSLVKSAQHLYSGSLVFTITWAYGNRGKVKWMGTAPGIDAYEAVHLPPSASISQLLSAWNYALHTVDKVPFRLSSATIDEVAIPAQDGAYYEPWAWALPGAPFDPSVQANWYAMVCQFFQTHQMKGIYFWGIWYSDGDAALPSVPSSGLAQEIQPASAQVIRNCFSEG